ncbi:MAG TPA: hypothetical protein VMG12_10410 [Polyangiaceae bacterium]|nr:hypothetical protein [Polyangiaceae bacterium]
MTSRADIPPSNAAAPRWVAPASRALRIGIDMASVAALIAARPGNGATLRVALFWALSLLAFPYARLAAHVGKRREAHLFFLLMGSLLALVGIAGQLGWLGERFRALAPASDSVWLGVAMALAGAASLRRAAASPVGGFACGVASIAAAAVWLSSALG